MTITIHGNSSMNVDSGSALEIKGAKMAKDQMEIEGKMALELIESAAASIPNVNPPTLSSGNNVNIKV
ncbi:cytoplasmic protein [Colwellia sp. MEBiC06753]